MNCFKREYPVLLHMLRGIVLGSVFFCFLLTNAYGARNITFSWTPNSDVPLVDGYRLYYKIGDPPSETDFSIAKASYDGTDASGGNASPINITEAGSNQYFMENLYEGQKYSFVLTSYRGTDESEPAGPLILEAIPESVPPDLILVDEVN